MTVMERVVDAPQYSPIASHVAAGLVGAESLGENNVRQL